MKKVIFGVMLLMMVSLVFAEAETTAENNVDSITAMIVANTSRNIQASLEAKLAAKRAEKSIGNIREQLLLMNETLREELKNLSVERKEMKQSENRVRLAVHALLAVRNETSPGIGEQVSAIARDFNNSNQKAINAEYRIMKRNAVMKFFFGAKPAAVDEVEKNFNANKERIGQLKQLKLNMTGNAANFTEEQIQAMEQENTRLEQVAKTQKAKRGILGWLLRI